MCEFEGKLVAWIDGELEIGAAREVEDHLRNCESCSAKAGEYREVTRAFAVYCAARPAGAGAFRWPRMTIGGVAAGAIAAAAIFWMLNSRVEQLPLRAPKTAEAPAIAFQTDSANSHTSVRLAKHAAVRHRAELPQSAWTRVEPSIEIALPADAIFAPGAVPPGISFAADLDIAGDGSPRDLRVLPGVYIQ